VALEINKETKEKKIKVSSYFMPNFLPYEMLYIINKVKFKELKVKSSWSTIYV